VFILGVLETSFLPHFQLLGATPFLVLAFITALSFKNRGIFHIFLAFAAGAYFDYISNGFPYTFLIVFLLTALIVRFFLYRDTSYDVLPTYLGSLALGTIAIYLFQIGTLIKVNFIGWQSYLLTIVSGLVLTLLAGYAIYVLLSPYFDWLTKESQEKFRG
jgi:uncharacterized membrane protein YjjP (DUF1212 family)